MNVGAIVLDLHQCLCEAIATRAEEEESYVPVCSCSVLWGDSVVLDHCGPEVECDSGGCGQAWVRLASVGPDPTVTDPRLLGCVMAFQVVLDVGIGRCSATAQHDVVTLTNVSEEDYMADFILGAEDMTVITNAVLCCMTKYKRHNLTIAAVAPFGPEGGCFGTSATVTLSVTV